MPDRSSGWVVITYTVVNSSIAPIVVMTTTKAIVGISSGSVMRPEAVPGVGAVDRGRLVVDGRDALQAGQEQHHGVAADLPDSQDRQRG